LKETKMDFVNDPARVDVIRQIRNAETLAEVRAAQSSLRQWCHQHPQDQGILDAGEELSLLEDALMEDDSPPGQSPSWTEWQRLEYQVIGARTLPEIAVARHALRRWVEHNPGQQDDGLVETLFLLLDVVEESQGGGGFPDKQGTRELAGQPA